MAYYLVTLAAGLGGLTLQNGVNAQLVAAASETQAKEVCNAKFACDGNPWTEATVTEVAGPTNWSGWTFEIDLCSGFGTGGSEPRSVSVVGTASNETIDKIAALLVTALQALTVPAHAAYNATTNVLTIASAADGIGNAKVLMRIIPPGGFGSVASLVGTITDKGAAAAALTVVLPADNAVVPGSIFQATQR